MMLERLNDVADGSFFVEDFYAFGKSGIRKQRCIVDKDFLQTFAPNKCPFPNQFNRFGNMDAS